MGLKTFSQSVAMKAAQFIHSPPPSGHFLFTAMQQSPYHVDSGFDELDYAYAVGSSSNSPKIAEMKLWAKVILNAFIDCGIARNQAKAPVGSNEAQVLKRRAAHWLLKDKQDFPMVCEMAGVNPAVIRQAAQKAMLAKLAAVRIL